MGSWDDLIDDLSASDDDELSPEHLADLWIMLGARSGSYAVGKALVALTDVDVAARAVSHLDAPDDAPMARASRNFLRMFVAQSSDREMGEWFAASRTALDTREPATDSEVLLTALRANLAGLVVTTTAGAGKTHLLLTVLADRLSPDDRLTAAAELASLHPDIESEGTSAVRSLLATVAARDRLVEELAGQPRYLVSAEDMADSFLRQARIAGEAIASIWEYPMLEPAAVAVALGAKQSNRERVRSYRERSWLLGLPRGRSYVYPQFQFNTQTHDVYDEVRQANELLRAASDPWGVASWWIAANDRLGAPPLELVGTSRASEIERAAQAVLEPVG